jgi:hypothetical protein
MAKIIIILFLSYFSLGANWYVDKGAAGTNAGTSWTNAWTAFSSIVWGTSCPEAKVCPGDTVFISGGTTSKTYTATEDGMLTVGASGTAGSPITIRTGQDSGHTGQVIFDGDGQYNTLIHTNGKSYITIDGSYNGTRNWRITNGKIGVPGGNYYDLISFYSGSSSGAKVILKYLQIDTGSNGIYIRDCDGFELDNLYIYGIHHDHLIAAEGSTGALGNNKIHHCDLRSRYDTSNESAGPDAIRGTYSLDIYNNIFSVEGDYSTIGGQHADMIQTDLHRNRIFNNRFNGAAAAVMMFNFTPTALEDFWFYNNVVIHSGWNGLDLGSDAGTTSITRFYILNNTFVDMTVRGIRGFNITNTSATITDFMVANNIMYNSGSGGMETFLIIATAEQCAAMTFDNNLVNAGAHGYTTFQCNYSNVTQAHGQTGAPSFVAYTEYSMTSDLRLAAGDTAARGHGANLSAFFTTDILGTTRSVWDIGAYEYTTGTVYLPFRY